MDPKALKALTLPQATMAEWLRISTRQLRNLKSELPPYGKDGTTVLYHLQATVQAFIDYRLSVRPTISEQDKEEAKARILLAQARKEEAFADKAEVEASEAKGKVAPIAEVRKAEENKWAQVKAQMRAIPPAWSPRIAGQKSPAKVQAMLEEAIDGALSRAARPADELADGSPCHAE